MHRVSIECHTLLLAALLRLALATLSALRVCGIVTLLFLQHAHCLAEVVLTELALFIHDEVDTLSARWEKIVLQRCWPEVGVYDVTRLLMRFAYPLCELHRIRDGRGQEDVAHRVWQKDDGLLPDHTTFLVSHVVNLVEDDPRDFAHNLGASVEHGPQNL